MCVHVTHQCVQVDVGPLNLLGLPAFLDHGPAQNIQVLLRGREQRMASVWIFYMHFSHSTTRGHNTQLVQWDVVVLYGCSSVYLSVDPSGTYRRDLIVVAWGKDISHGKISPTCPPKKWINYSNLSGCSLLLLPLLKCNLIPLLVQAIHCIGPLS